MDVAQLVSVRGSLWTIVGRVTHGDCEAVRLRGVQPHNAGELRTLLTPFDRLRPVEQPAWKALRPRAWMHAVRRLELACHPFGGLQAAATARIDLLPYQLEPAQALLCGLATRLLIADEVGLGKTIQAGLVLAELAARRDGLRGLVLTPASLRDQWRDELASRFALDSVKADTRWLAATTRSLPPDVNPWSLPGIYIASCDLVKRAEVLRPLEDVTWDVAIIDEAHAAAPGTDRHAAVHAIASRARRVILLTATPHAGDSEHFDALCRIGELGGGGAESEPPLAIFRRTRADVRCDEPRRTSLLPVRPSRAERRMHRLVERYCDRIHTETKGGSDGRGVLAAIVLRKRALSSAGSLLQSSERRLDLLAGCAVPDTWQMLLPLGDEDPLEDAFPDSLLAAPGLADTGRERRMLGAVVRAARAAAAQETKIRFLLRLLRRIHEPVIIFTEYRDTLERLAVALRGARHRPLMLHGGLPADERTEVQRSFNESGCVLLATDAASEGLNLHGRCRVVVHYELPWNPMRLQQRAGRVDRIGQRRRVHEIVLVASDTAEGFVLAPLARRIARARNATAGARPLFESLTESRVAAAVLVGAPIVDDDASAGAASGSSLDLEEAAGREAARLLLHRSWRERSGNRTQRDRVAVAFGCQPASPVHVTAIYRVALRAADGGIVHARLVPVDASIPAPQAEGCRLPRQIASALTAEGDSAFREVVRAAEGPELECAAERHLRAAGVMRVREAAIASLVPSTSRQLVQAGLFEHRSTRAADARRRVHRALLDDAEDRLSAAFAAPPGATFELVAVMVRGSRRGRR